MIIILDIETQELVPEDRDLSKMRISLTGVHYDDTIKFFSENELGLLFPLLDAAELVVGHNLIGFDYKILQRYAHFDVQERYKQKTFDFMRIIIRKTDRRVSLNDLAKRNLGLEKAGLGKDAPQLFQDGKIGELRAYLEQDLRITQQLFEHIKRHGKVKYGHIVYKEPIEKEVSINVTER